MAHYSSPDGQRILAGTVLGLVVGKPAGILLASWLSVWVRIAVAPEGVTMRQFVGAACLCGVGDTMALLMADRAFSLEQAALAKLGVLVGSVIAGCVGLIVLRGAAHVSTPRTT
jgi:NhaA family Na+:H+ antiporter